MYFVIIDDLTSNADQKFYWNRGIKGFSNQLDEATQFRTHDNAYVELFDEGLSAHVHAIQPIGS